VANRAERVDVFVIGGGGLGSDVTSALAGAGLSVVMAERGKLGGECSHYGCDPTKAMLKSARVAAQARRAGEFGVRVPSVDVDFAVVMTRVRRLIEQETSAGARPYEDRGARVIMQEARLTGPHRVELADGTVFEADRIVLATGSEPTAPPIPGLDAGGYWTSREAIWHGGPVPRSLAILGAGPIGVEFAQIYARFGSTVTLVAGLDRLLAAEDATTSDAVAPALARDGIDLRVGVEAAAADRTVDGGWSLSMTDGSTLTAERLLVATGRRPCFDQLDLDAAGVRLDDEGLPVLDETLRTTAGHIWAGGDAKGFLMFTHVNGYDAEVIVADILGHPFPKDYRVVPRVTFCEPEVASVGLTEDEARPDHRVVTATVTHEHNARAFLEGDHIGMVKLVADAETGEVLGGHIVAESAGELVHEVVAAMAARMPVTSVGHAVHAYPTRSEMVRAAFRELATKLG
jgi:pyruvate/2-oxoglutarate dehydrogenase complex dihydrolipoamide dehydrogenase (E3) component